MDTSSMGSGIDSDEDIPMAVPVESIVNNNNNQGDTTSNKKVDTVKKGELNTTLDTADGQRDEKIGSTDTDTKPPPQPTEETKSTSPTTSGKKRANSEVSADPVTSNDPTPASKKKKTSTNTDSAKKERPKACQGLTIPFRTIKRIMKIDTSVGIVQNDAAIVVTAALEHFVKELATKALKLSEKKGRGTIKYEDVAEVRAADRSLSFLDLLMP